MPYSVVCHSSEEEIGATRRRRIVSTRPAARSSAPAVVDVQSELWSPPVVASLSALAVGSLGASAAGVSEGDGVGSGVVALVLDGAFDGEGRGDGGEAPAGPGGGGRSWHVRRRLIARSVFGWRCASHRA